MARTPRRSRARAKAAPAVPKRPGAPPVAERVDAIAELMIGGQYHGAATVRELAQRWGISALTVDGHAAEASRVVARDLRATPEQREARRLRIIAAVEARATVALKDRDAIAAYKLLAELEGMLVQKHEITAPPLSPNEARARLAVLQERLETLRAAEDAIEASEPDP